MSFFNRIKILQELIASFSECIFIHVIRSSHAERDVSMKKQLVEDLKTRLKFLQEMEKSYRGQVDELEKKVKNTTCYLTGTKIKLWTLDITKLQLLSSYLEFFFSLLRFTCCRSRL